jgi:mitogen-activated protein kinase 1/3
MPNNHFIPKLISVMKNEESIFLVMELKRSDLATLFKED